MVEKEDTDTIIIWPAGKIRSGAESIIWLIRGLCTLNHSVFAQFVLILLANIELSNGKWSGIFACNVILWVPFKQTHSGRNQDCPSDVDIAYTTGVLFDSISSL